MREGKSFRTISRRYLLGLWVGGVAASISAACHAEGSKGGTALDTDRGQRAGDREAREGILLARPKQKLEGGSAAKGRQTLKVEGGREGLLYVPDGYAPERPAPLALMLHGAGGDARHGLSLLQSFADKSGIILLAPSSRDQTWDVLVNRYGADVAVIDRALEQTFSRYAVDQKRLAVGGFSDGASYALSLGLTNGDLFTHVIAFSPGFMAPSRQKGSPRLYISHGTGDRVLPIDRCSRRIVPQVTRAGYDVKYREFDGPHTIPPEIAREAVDWFTS